MIILVTLVKSLIKSLLGVSHNQVQGILIPVCCSDRIFEALFDECWRLTALLDLLKGSAEGSGEVCHFWTKIQFNCSQSVHTLNNGVCVWGGCLDMEFHIMEVVLWVEHQSAQFELFKLERRRGGAEFKARLIRHRSFPD